MKRYIALGLIVMFVFSVAVSASMFITVNDKAKENAKAPEKSPMITETEAGEWGLERVDFIHYARPPCNNDGTCDPGENKGCADCKNGKGGGDSGGGVSCYDLLGVKWKSLPVDYVINPTGSGLSAEFVTTAISTAAETWDAATPSELFNDTYTVNYTAQYGVQNYENTIAFGDYPESDVIGVTSIWYTRRGRRIVEFDILFDTDFTWGDATVNLTVMDLQNIAVHELGHGAGLDDIYTSSCAEVTMYGYSTEGETEKRTLEPADIAGIQKLYGA